MFLKLHNEYPCLDRYDRVTAENIKELAAEGYFENINSPAAASILPYVNPEHVGVEIGVFMGTSSQILLDYCKHMYLIDPCVEYDDNPDKGMYAHEIPFLELLAPYKERFTFIKGFSADVSDQVPMVDFIFIDGNHMYDYVKKDVELYWPKIKPGGFLSGHDYTGGHPGVTKAVDEFFAKLGLPVEQHQYCWKVDKGL